MVIAALLLFWFTVVGFAVYMGVRTVWVKLHWITKLLLAPFWFAYPADCIFGATFLTVYFLEIPPFNAVTISQRCKKHKDDSKLAAFIWGEIRKIDPTHLD